jgi:hypothetical protein
MTAFPDMLRIIKPKIFRPVLAILLLFSVQWSYAQDSDDAGADAKHLQWKFTPSYYDNSDGSNAYDLNLRADFGDQRAWIGEYRDSHGYNQARAGFDAVTQVGIVNLDFSGQYATGGFWGGSLMSQIGGDTYAMLGWGRTDLHPYYNLNFDPNDAITAGFGTKSLLQDLELQLYHIWDDRTPSKQHVTHLLAHYDVSKHEHFSVDVSFKHGLADPQTYVKGYATTLTYAWDRVFARLAYDQHANFALPNQTRLSVGLLF